MNFIEKFREAVKIPTYWPPAAQKEDIAGAEAVLTSFQQFLTNSFPTFHKTAECWVLSPYSVIYHLPGKSKTDEKSKAVLLLAHYDVVPCETEKWSVNPFGAEIKDNYIYGRGTLDMKSILISILEAAENLCSEGWKPASDIWFAFGGDEERTGLQGAIKANRWFAERGLHFDWILDEGTPIAKDQIKGVNTPLALISIEEKGYLSLKLSVKQMPGHASQPPKIQAAAVLGQALTRIAKKHFPFRLCPTVESFFKELSPHIHGIQGFAMRHCRALGNLFFKLAASSPAIAAMLRTTIAMTQLEGSNADNILPSEVCAIINLRLLKPWTIETAAAYVKKAINDERVNISVHGLATDPVAANGSFREKGWQELEKAINETYPGIPVLPFIMIATTDSRHYEKIADKIYRFGPHILDPKDMGGVHGHDERISIENLNRGLTFYSTLMRLL